MMRKVWFSMVGVAQLVERWFVAPVVVGSNPIAHPIFSGFGLLAQLAEQLTLNQRVVGSSPTQPTKIKGLQAAAPWRR